MEGTWTVHSGCKPWHSWHAWPISGPSLTQHALLPWATAVHKLPLNKQVKMRGYAKLLAGCIREVSFL